MKNKSQRYFSLLLALIFILSFVNGCDLINKNITQINDIPAFSDRPYTILNNNIPEFEAEKFKAESFEKYLSLDSLGRCNVAFACIGKDIMPTEKRQGIGQIKPSGWKTVKYDIVDGKYLYNRCHLIGYQLSGENANERNLITGTRYLNVEGMLPFENMVADYVKETQNHVLYRVTPIFEGNNLVASGVKMEGYSLEDNGEGISFNVYCYNIQPGIKIDYSDGQSSLNESVYVLNVKTNKFHLLSCEKAFKISSKNRKYYDNSRYDLIKNGYTPCKECNP